MKVIQINLNHCQTAQDILTKMVKDEGADVVLISEPYKIPENNVWICDKTRSAAIWACGRHAFQEVNYESEGFARAKINGIHFYSCYARPSWTTVQYGAMLDHLISDATARSPVVIGGDFNAWAMEWGSRRTNTRGRMLLEAFAPLEVGIANNGGALTYRKAGTGSIIDITLVSNALMRKLKWWVSEEFTSSDHQAVLFNLNTGRTGTTAPKLTGPKWKDSAFDKDSFEVEISEANLTETSADGRSRELTQVVSRACDVSMPRRTPSKRGTPCYWWNEEIKTLRSKCFKARRAVQRSRGRPNFEHLLAALRVARQELKKAIKDSKSRCFKQLCDDADVNPWGTAYRMVMSKLKKGASPQITCPNMLKSIIKDLFPRRQNTIFQVFREPNDELAPEITMDELLKACSRIGDRKAPGPDGIPNVAVKTAIQRRPELFLRTFQACLDEGLFPRQWKKQHLVLLPKGKKPPGEPASYRPICLLDTMGKILERIICNRLTAVAEENNALANFQFGFRKSRSTVDAIKSVVDKAAAAIQGVRWREGSKEYCAVVTLDVRNAFNSASWSAIKKALARMDAPVYLRRILSSYLSDRQLVYSSDEGAKYYDVSAGVPQGSVLGPLLWNIMYDGVLRLELPGRVQIVGFADDIAVVVVAKHISDIEATANEAIRRINSWLDSNGLELAEHKTEAVLITSRKRIETISLQVGHQTINSKSAIKYLGVMLDNRLQFKEHASYISGKASRVQAALSRILPNIGGPSYVRRLLLSKVVSSILAYAAPVWAHAMTIQETRRKLASVHRLSALRVISGYRTISEDAALVIAGMLPIDIMAEEMARIYSRRIIDKQAMKAIKDEERATSMTKWQDRWNNTEKGRWTYTLIPSITTWVNREHGDCGYHLTQFLSGHGGYRKYLHRFGHDDSPMCPSCDAEEDTEHAVFYCERFYNWRTDFPDPSNVISFMLVSKDGWQTITNIVTNIQKELRRIEGERRASAQSGRLA